MIQSFFCKFLTLASFCVFFNFDANRATAQSIIDLLKPSESIFVLDGYDILAPDYILEEIHREEIRFRVFEIEEKIYIAFFNPIDCSEKFGCLNIIFEISDKIAFDPVIFYSMSGENQFVDRNSHTPSICVSHSVAFVC